MDQWTHGGSVGSPRNWIQGIAGLSHVDSMSRDESSLKCGYYVAREPVKAPGFRAGQNGVKIGKNR